MADTDLALPSRLFSREDFLYPPLSPNRTGRLRLDSLHTMYWEESGNPRGAPVVFLHGGPGGGSAPDHRRFYDPAFYRIIVYDQRGAGQSTPLGALTDNTTPHLIADLERLRTHLGAERWLVFGGSWGSTLALAYAEAHPDRVRGLVLRGIFLCRPLEIRWFLYEMRFIFPEAWRVFAGFLSRVNNFRGVARPRKHLRIGQMIVDDHVRLLDALFRPQRDQPEVPRPRADQISSSVRTFTVH